MIKSAVKDFHMQLPLGLFEAFQRAFPRQGERKIIVEELIKEAITMQAHKTYYTRLIGKNVEGRLMRGEIDGLGDDNG